MKRVHTVGIVLIIGITLLSVFLSSSPQSCSAFSFTPQCDAEQFTRLPIMDFGDLTVAQIGVFMICISTLGLGWLIRHQSIAYNQSVTLRTLYLSRAGPSPGYAFIPSLSATHDF